MLRLSAALVLTLSASAAFGAPNVVKPVKDDQGWRLQVDGEDTFLFGMNWGYVPIGTNYGYNFWDQPDDFIEGELRKEMALLKAMGINTIRQYDVIPPRWVTWIYDNYGIYTLINPLVGRYGATIDGTWIPTTNYGDPRTREVLTEQTLTSAARYADTRGVLGFMLGNEANYGLSWSSFEIEALPKGERDSARARALYTLYSEIIDGIHKIDPNHPVAICNGDLQYIDIIAEEVDNMDFFATNVYRGRTGRDLYDVVAAKLDKPVFYSEFGADAYDAKNGREDGTTQATYFRDQWEDVYLHAHGNGRVGNAIGGYIFQWSDGWWKYKQEENLDVHDTNASWPNDAYPEDLVPGKNNMNEEWFGITAKTPPDPNGAFNVQPREAYYVLKDAFSMHPYEATPEEIVAHFDTLEPANYATEVAAFKALAATQSKRVELSQLRLDLGMTGAMGTYKRGSGPLNANVDHTQSIYVGGQVRPTDTMRAEAVVNVLGNVSDNPIDNIRYENRGARAPSVEGQSIETLERVAIYNANFEWNQPDFDLKGFYRTGHYHWGYEGDVWGLYPEANYGPNLDQYFGMAPIGVELTGKNRLEGVAVALGPQLWWGANPATLIRASKNVLGGRWTVVHHEDLATTSNVSTTVAVSEQVTRRTGLSGEYNFRGWTLEMSGLFAGSNKVGQAFTYTTDATDADRSYQESGKHLVEDVVRWQDTFGGKVRLAREESSVRVFLEGGVQGLVADGGWDARVQQLGLALSPSGRGNQWHANGTIFLPKGSFMLGLNALANKPLIGPNAPMADSYDSVNSWYYPGINGRNFRDDPFAVLENRETYAGELVLVYDPTPGSYFFAWDNIRREDAKLAASLNLVYRHQPTVRDAYFSFTDEGVLFAFNGSPPASDEWIATGRIMVNAGATKLMFAPYVGQQQARGIDERLLTRGGVDWTAARRRLGLRGFVKINDWGPFDYYRDFNLTYPLQTMVDVSSGLGKPDPFDPSTRLGIRGKWRLLDENSPVGQFDINPGIGNANGWEGEIFTYIQVMR